MEPKTAVQDSDRLRQTSTKNLSRFTAFKIRLQELNQGNPNLGLTLLMPFQGSIARVVARLYALGFFETLPGHFEAPHIKVLTEFSHFGVFFFFCPQRHFLPHLNRVCYPLNRDSAFLLLLFYSHTGMVALS